MDKTPFFPAKRIGKSLGALTICNYMVVAMLLGVGKDFHCCHILICMLSPVCKAPLIRNKPDFSFSVKML